MCESLNRYLLDVKLGCRRSGKQVGKRVKEQNEHGVDPDDRAQADRGRSVCVVVNSDMEISGLWRHQTGEGAWIGTVSHSFTLHCNALGPSQSIFCQFSK